MKKHIYSILIAAGMALGVSSCGGFLDKLPTDSVVDKSAMRTLYDAGVVVNGLYTNLKYYTMYGTYMAQMGDMRADNLYPKDMGGTGSTIYTIEYEPTQSPYFSLWSGYYTTIMRANTLIENIGTLEVTTAADIATKNDYLGQAYAVRALCYFDLARLYGKPYLFDKGASLGAVIVTTPVAPSEARLPRKTVADTYTQVFGDLKDALGLLSKAKNTGHFNYWAARLLQAKAYLYTGDYPNAYKAAVEVINDSPYRYVPNADYLAYWGKEGDDESVLELLVSTEGDIDPDGGFYTIYHNLWFDDKNAGHSIIPTKKWRELFKDTPNDVRAQMIAYDDLNTGVVKSGEYWLKKFIGNKDMGYTFRRNNPRVLRITDAYLIAAEAGIEAKEANADNYLNTIRKRADPTATDIKATVALVQTERQKEFIGEGDRFFDVMRRGGTITRDMSIDPHDYAGTDAYKKSFSWDYDKVALPISHTERMSYPELQQNPGYKE